MKRHSLRHGAEMSPPDLELFKQRVLGDVSKIREHLQEFPHTNDYAFGMKQIISKILKMIFCRLSKFETYGQFYQTPFKPSQDATGFGFESCWLCWLLRACWKAFFSWQPREERCKVEVDLVDPHSRRTKNGHSEISRMQ